MKKLIIASALSAAFVSPAVLAQAQNFEGFGLQLSTGYQHNEMKASEPTFNGSTLEDTTLGFPTTSKGEMALNIGASYTHAFTNRFTLGAMVEYNPLSMKTGSSYLTENGVSSTSPDDRFEGKLKNQFSLSLVPGYAFNESTMGYARVGWINATAELSSDAETFSTSVNGVLLGLGARHLFTDNIYGFAEATYADYGGSNASVRSELDNGVIADIATDLTPSSYSFLVGVGVRF